MLQTILAVTICAPDLGAIEVAYTRYLSYEPVARGRVSQAAAQLWRAPAMAGREYLMLRPPSGADVCLRFVQAEPVAGYAALRTLGWNAAELLVESPDALAEALGGSPFQIVGPPRGLSSNEAIRAMQVIGPAGELLYLTSIPPDEATFGLQPAQSEVDRVFIVVVGGHDLTALREFYATRLALPVSGAFDVRVSVLSQAYSLDPEQRHPLAIARMAGAPPAPCLIELDQYPAAAIVRPVRAGELPPGIALVSFAVEQLDAPDAMTISDAFYAGRRAQLLRGAAGELIELIETK